MAELAPDRAHPDGASEAGERGAAPSVDEVWQLLRRADVIVRALLEAHDRAARERCQERARAWLCDVNQAWVHTPALRPTRDSGPAARRRP